MKYLSYIPQVVVLAFSAKLLILGGDWASVGLLAVSVAYAVLSSLQEKNKEINELKERYDKLTLGLAENIKKTEQLQTHVAGLKIGQNLRVTPNGR